MSIFSNILNKIFHHPSAAAKDAAAGATAPSASSQGTAPAATSQVNPGQAAPNVATPTPTASSAAPAGAAGAAGATGQQAPVDVEAVLTKLQSGNSQQLNWRTSIVDLMKLLDLESDLASRKELAKELGYTGDTGDSATMNVWLHKQVMKKLAENGGKVPESLK